MADFWRERAFLPLLVVGQGADREGMTAYVLLAALVLLAVTAVLWGADSRDGRDWQPRRHHH
jgi:hypothetical protein